MGKKSPEATCLSCCGMQSKLIAFYSDATIMAGVLHESECMKSRPYLSQALLKAAPVSTYCQKNTRFYENFFQSYLKYSYGDICYKCEAGPAP